MVEEQLEAAAEPGATASVKDPVVLAAQRMVVDVFNLAAAQMPDLLKAQAPGGAEMQKFTAAMLTQLQAQLTRALGVEPEDEGGSKP